MRACIVITSLGAGGAELSTVELLPALDAAGIEAHVVCLRSAPVGWESEVRSSGTALSILRPTSPIGQVRQLRALLRRERPHLVHTALFDADVVGRLAALGGPPVLTSLVNTPYDPERLRDPAITPWTLTMARAIDVVMAGLTTHFHAISPAVRDAVVEQLHIQPRAITVIPRGRDRARLGTRTASRRREARRALGVDDDRPLVLAVGRQEYQKGHRHLIDAFGRVTVDHPGAVLVIAGREGAVTDDLRWRADRLGHDHVRLLGHRQDVPDLLCAADVFAMPSLYEGLGGAAIEALALRCPVVASDLGAFRDFLRDGHNSALVPPRDEDALARAIGRLLSSRTEACRLAEAGADDFERHFALPTVNQQMVDLYRRVARKHSFEALVS